MSFPKSKNIDLNLAGPAVAELEQRSLDAADVKQERAPQQPKIKQQNRRQFDNDKRNDTAATTHVNVADVAGARRIVEQDLISYASFAALTATEQTDFLTRCRSRKELKNLSVCF